MMNINPETMARFAKLPAKEKSALFATATMTAAMEVLSPAEFAESLHMMASLVLDYAESPASKKAPANGNPVADAPEVMNV